jgi:hypothetical protein
MFNAGEEIEAVNRLTLHHIASLLLHCIAQLWALVSLAIG